MSKDREISRIARRQEALVTPDQLATAGLSARTARREAERGRLERLEPGVLRVGGAPPTWKQRLLAACITEDGYACDRSAAALYELEGFAPRWIEVTVRRWSRRPNRSVRIRESLYLTDADVTVVDGIPCVTIEWLLIHLGARVPRAKVEQALDDALRRGLTTPEKIRDVFVRVARRGVRGVGVIRPLLARRLGTTGPQPNEFERLLYRILDQAGLPLPIPQYEIRDEHGAFVARPDWAYPARRLAIECVSDEWHSGRVRRMKDAARRNKMQRVRWDVLEFTYDHVRHDKAYVAEEVGAHLLA